MERPAAIDEIAGIIAEIHLSHPVRVAVDGRDGAGKTILSDELVGPLQSRGREVIRASMDGFHNPRSVRYARGRTSPEGYFRASFNYDGFLESLLFPLGPGGTRQYRTCIFDYRTDSPVVSPLKQASDNAMLIVDGIFLLRPELIDYWDFRVFVDVAVQVGLDRCARRDSASPDPDAESNRRSVEGHELYFAECNPRESADVVFVNNKLSDPSILRRSRSRKSQSDCRG